MKVLVVDDHTTVAEALRLGLESEGMTVRVWDGTEDVIDLCAGFRPDVVILDLDLGDDGSGVELAPALAAEGRRILVLTGLTDDGTLASAYEAGVDAVIDKSTAFADLVERITKAAAGHGHDPRRDAIMQRAREAAVERQRRLAPFSRLTERESQVLALLVEGRRATEIADATFVSMATVRSHIRSILTKLGVTSQLEAVSMAIKAGWTTRWRHPSARRDT